MAADVMTPAAVAAIREKFAKTGAGYLINNSVVMSLCDHADALTAENERLRAALERIGNAADSIDEACKAGGIADQLLRAILAVPEDDAPRLAYADWLDENGQDKVAEFIRWQIAGNLISVRLTSLVALESILGCQPHECRRTAAPGKAEVIAKNGTAFTFRRGFVAEVRCTLAAFMGGPCQRCRSAGWDGAPDCPDCKGEGDVPGIAAELFRRQPVERVTLTDRWPMFYVGRQHCWHDGASSINGHANPESDLPGELWAALGGYDGQEACARIYSTRDAALAALSAAAVRHGRRLAGLT